MGRRLRRLVEDEEMKIEYRKALASALMALSFLAIFLPQLATALPGIPWLGKAGVIIGVLWHSLEYVQEGKTGG